MKKFEVIALFDHEEKKTVVEAMDESEALDKWGIENEFKYDYVTKVTEIKEKQKELKTNYKVFLQRLPKTEDEAFLLNHGYIKPFRIVCEESEVSDVAGHLINTIPSKDSNNIQGLLEQCYCRSFEEYDPFYEHSMGRRFIFCSESWLPNAGGGQLNFSLCPELSAPQEMVNHHLANDKLAVYQILMRRDMDDRAKAQSLLTLLLDRQMAMDDVDYCTETDATRLSSAAYAEFFDRTMGIIRELSPEVHEANFDQITLPSVQNFADRYK